MAAELSMQSKCYLWFHNTYPAERQMLFRVKNELDNHPYKSKQDIFKQLSENKSTGVIAGPSDFVFILYRKTVFIELKVAGGKQSDDQKEFERKVLEREQEYYVVWSFEEFQNLIITLLHDNRK